LAGDDGGRLGVSGGTAGEEFLAEVEESLFERGRFKPIEGTAGDENEVEAGGEGQLMGAKPLAKTAFRARAGDGIAHGGSGGDKTGAGRAGRGAGGFRGRDGRFRGKPGGLVWERADRARSVIKHKGAAIEAAPLGADVVEVGRPTQVLVGAKAHGVEAGEPGLARPGA